MVNSSGVSRRLQQSAIHMQDEDHEGALINNLFPALDKTAKKRRPKFGVSRRIRAFLEDEEKLISAISTGNIFADIRVNDVSIPEALYKFGRTPIAHEGELDPRLKFNLSNSIRIGVEKWNLPSSYILGMFVAVVIAPENSDEKMAEELHLTVLGRTYQVNELWGKKELFQNLVCEQFNNPTIFQ